MKEAGLISPPTRREWPLSELFDLMLLRARRNISCAEFSSQPSRVTNNTTSICRLDVGLLARTCS